VRAFFYSMRAVSLASMMSTIPWGNSGVDQIDKLFETDAGAQGGGGKFLDDCPAVLNCRFSVGGSGIVNYGGCSDFYDWGNRFFDCCGDFLSGQGCWGFFGRFGDLRGSKRCSGFRDWRHFSDLGDPELCVGLRGPLDVFLDGRGWLDGFWGRDWRSR
jgi:hypothetical protein